jgi:hypothetical protein
MLRALFCFFLVAISACAPKNNIPKKQIVLTPQEVRQAQEKRTSAMKELVGRGVIELHWRDEDGKHRAQGDFDFWRLGNAVSLRVSKAGEVVMWIGGDEQNHWVFDMLGDETTLSINQQDIIFSEILDTLVLLGLDPLPEGNMTIANGVVTVEEKDRLWIATFDPSTHRILEIELDLEHTNISALHRKGIKVELIQKNRLVWPVTGGLIDLTSATNSATKNSTTKIDVAWISTDTSEERMDRVFDLEFLRRALKPTKTKGLPQ